jgi:hypothetical protein
VLLLLNVAVYQLSRAVGDIAATVFEHFQAQQRISKGHAAAAVGKHHIFAAVLVHADPDGAAFSPVPLAACYFD